MRPLLLAFGLLTRLPMPPVAAPTERELGQSPLWYPLVGGVIGLLLAAAAQALITAPLELAAVLLLVGWVSVTGGLHLDGLADTADAWVGGMGDRARTLAILKDACSGPAAVTALVLVLLVKFVVIKELLLLDHPWLLAVPPLLGRLVLLALLWTTPYVRPGGMGASAAAHLPQRAGALVCLAVAAGCGGGVALGLGGSAALWLLGGAAGLFLLLRRAFLQRLGGTTGDTAGALCEITEAVAAAILVWHL